MEGFLQEYWDRVWYGWTPIVMVIFFLIGMKLGIWLSGYFIIKGISIFIKIILPISFSGLIPIFSMLAHNKKG